MKRYTESAIILFAALSLVGCSKTEEFQHNPDSALQIESVSGISPFALTTKAVITGNTLPDSDAATGIGIFVTASDGSAYDGHNKGYTNVNFANSGSGWSTSTPVYLSDTEGKLYGYFPYNADANELKAIPVQSSLNGTDYLYAEPQTVSHSNKNVSLQMNHALSRLHLTIKKGANFTAEAPLSKIVLKSTAIDATGTMDLTTGAITASKKPGETGTVELPTDGTITAEGIEKDILLVPADNSEGKKDITLILTIGGKLASVSLSGENGIDIRSGIQNNVTLTIEDTGIKVSGVGVGEWGEGFSQQVEVNSHKVTVKLADDIPASNVTFNVYVEGLSVKIIAFPIISQGLICQISGMADCDRVRDSRDIHTFTVSEIQSDVIATIEQAPLPAGALKGGFTVADDGNRHVKKVYFSQGNLYYDGSKFDFEANQYEFHGYDSANNTWGLFGWVGASSTAFTSSPAIYGASTSTTIADYGNSATDALKADWGTAIDDKGTWRTLSTAEWQYLFNTRTMANGGARSENLTSSGITVEGVTFKGVVLFPDDFTDQADWRTKYTTWKALNDAGLVFLPAAGYRDGSSVYNVGVDGFYWSSSAFIECSAYYVNFDRFDVYPGSGGDRYYGYSVRLITESY